ncbi:hypothetical protein IPJ72_01590 [Candidatus Peregrinibacteria bacterium]|nr:MAG: hypothetical protein IPJ72_01590 [Candidatus Peregrinibacteria bacterium]
MIKNSLKYLGIVLVTMLVMLPMGAQAQNLRGYSQYELEGTVVIEIVNEMGDEASTAEWKLFEGASSAGLRVLQGAGSRTFIHRAERYLTLQPQRTDQYPFYTMWSEGSQRLNQHGKVQFKVQVFSSRAAWEAGTENPFNAPQNSATETGVNWVLKWEDPQNLAVETENGDIEIQLEKPVDVAAEPTEMSVANLASENNRPYQLAATGNTLWVNGALALFMAFAFSRALKKR